MKKRIIEQNNIRNIQPECLKAEREYYLQNEKLFANNLKFNTR
jgi:hypothetical protein